MRTFAYVVLQRWGTVVLASALTTIFAVTAFSVGSWVPLALGVAAQAIFIPFLMLAPLRRVHRGGAPDWRREVWGPVVRAYSATAPPFDSQPGSATMIRSTATISSLGVPGGRYERLDVPHGLLLPGRGIPVELLHLDHWMPTVVFGRVPEDDRGSEGPGVSASGPGIESGAPGVGFAGDAMLVSGWMTDRALASLSDLLERVPWVTLSGSTIYAHGHRPDHDSGTVLARLTELALELRPALRREHGEPVEPDEQAPPVSGTRGTPALAWMSLASLAVLPLAGVIFGLGAVAAPAEGRWMKILAWASLALNVLALGLSAALWRTLG